MSTAAIININHKDVATFLHDAKSLLIQKVNAHLHKKNSLKINTVLAANFGMIKDDVIQTVTKYFSDVYADSESILEKIDDTNGLEKRKTHSYQKHIPSSIAYYLKCSYDNSLTKFELKRSSDCIDCFLEELQNIAFTADKIIEDIKPLSLTYDEEQKFLNETKCHICEKTYVIDDVRCRDHCHITGKYRGSAHASCNINYQDSCTIPVVFHSLRTYDGHHIIKRLQNKFPGRIDLLALNKESYISFTKWVDGTRIKLRFIDLYRFLASSIDSLSKNSDNAKKEITKSFCKSEEEFKLITKKGVFPYDYVDSWEKFDETTLPSKNHFYSQLNEEDISDEAYEHAHNVWQTFHIKSLGEYSDLYLQTDVALLADIFKSFRTDCLQTYKLDPAHYYTLPGLSFSAMLRYTQIELELLTDPEMMFFIEQGIRGELSQCSNRYGKANNRFMGNEYDPEEEESFLMYFDLNNMYGAAMMESLPTHNLKWESNFDPAILDSISDDSKIGYILEVDLEYSSYLHHHHKDFPLAPVREKPPLKTSKTEKLLATLNSKEKYVIHYQYGDKVKYLYGDTDSAIYHIFCNNPYELIQKIALSWNNDKRRLKAGETDTLPWSYKYNQQMCLSSSIFKTKFV
ncbi:uncharacterized protein LOC122856426 [Aphidius gifuensis]|uniref:uncharacterized protein LOC122856426 n=1 Tax=Aphidius gifuensis TaxID=684658 RepID=UPI001CDD0953|nr:uncharacterized protein LOC122856426 [Aphidius gifuensis]